MNASAYSEDVESFEMLDVVNFAGILELYQVSDVRLPRVQRMQELSLRSYKGGTADLGRLVESELIGVAGVWEYESILSRFPRILTAKDEPDIAATRWHIRRHLLELRDKSLERSGIWGY